MRRTVLAALAMLSADQLGHFGPHQLLRDRPHRLADHVTMLIAQHPPDDLLDRHPVPTGHRRPPFVEALRTPTIMSAAVTGPPSIRPTRSYTTLWDVTQRESDRRHKPSGPQPSPAAAVDEHTRPEELRRAREPQTERGF
jgi:hypothetical protein